MILEAFFSLVRAGLWDTPAVVNLFRGLTPAQWQEVHRLARTQSLLAIVFDGINTLPAELHPPRPFYLQWATRTLQVEQANDHLNRMVERLDRLYYDAGLRPVLLKGQGMAACYRNPRHRQCGDIDIYIGKEGQSQANLLLLQSGACGSGESYKHASYELYGVHIENHRIFSRMHNPLANHRFTRLVRDLRRLGLLRAARAFGYVVVNRLGLPAEYLPFDTVGCQLQGEELVKEIFATGNFGKYDRRVPPRLKGYRQGKWHSFCHAIRRSRDFANTLRQKHVSIQCPL